MSLLDSVPVYGSYRKSKEADGICERARSRYRHYSDRLQEARDESEQAVDKLLEVKVKFSTEVMPEAVDLLGRVHKINYQGVNLVDETYINFRKNAEPEIRKNKSAALQVVDAGVKGTSAGAALALGSMGMVSSFGAASTGTAIASLSGVAAQNATLAWFGGGALSAGGAGMAGGAMVLGGIALAPVAVIGAYKYASHAEKKMTEAIRYRNTVDVEVEKIEACIEVAEAANLGINLFSDTLSGLGKRLINEMVFLERVIGADNPGKEVSLSSAKIILIVKSIKRLLEVKVVSEEGFSKEAEMAIAHAENIDESRVGQFVQEVCEEKDIRLPEEVKYLRELQPGEYGPQYFWFQGEYEEVPGDKEKNKSGNHSWGQMISSLLIWGVWSGIAFYARWEFWPWFFMVLAVLSPVSIWARGMPKEKKDRVNGVVGLILITFVLVYFVV